MKIRIFSDIHVDVNERFPFSIKEGERDVFTLVAGDVSGNPKLTAKWVKSNIHNGILIAGNHDPSYNRLGWTVNKAKKYLAQKFPIDGPVTFLDESIGVMVKEIPGTNVLVVASTLYTDYKYASEWTLRCIDDANKRRKEHGEGELTLDEVNFSAAARGLNDFRWGHVEDEIEVGKQRYLRPDDYKKWFERTFKRIVEIVEGNPDRDIIVMTHHCPSPKCIAEEYVKDNMNASYVSDLEDFIFKHPNIKAWVCGHVHSTKIEKLGENGQWLVCNPRGYEKNMESTNWTPNVFLDTDTWMVSKETYENKRLEAARKKFHDDFMKLAPFFL